MARKTRVQMQAETRESAAGSPARAAFGRKGFAGASIDEIAEGAGFSRGAFYSNFSSKEDLAVALMGQQMAMDVALIGKVAEAADGPPDTLPERLAKAFPATEKITEWELLRLEMLMLTQRDPAFALKCQELYKPQRERTAAVESVSCSPASAAVRPRMTMCWLTRSCVSASAPRCCMRRRVPCRWAGSWRGSSGRWPRSLRQRAGRSGRRRDVVRAHHLRHSDPWALDYLAPLLDRRRVRRETGAAAGDDRLAPVSRCAVVSGIALLAVPPHSGAARFLPRLRAAGFWIGAVLTAIRACCFRWRPADLWAATGAAR